MQCTLLMFSHPVVHLKVCADAQRAIQSVQCLIGYEQNILLIAKIMLQNSLEYFRSTGEEMCIAEQWSRDSVTSMKNSVKPVEIMYLSQFLLYLPLYQR